MADINDLIGPSENRSDTAYPLLALFRRISVPRIDGDVDDEVDVLPDRIANEAIADGLVADQEHEPRRAGRVFRNPVTGVVDAGGLDAIEARNHVAQRHVFTERHEDVLVVALVDQAVAMDSKRRIVRRGDPSGVVLEVVRPGPDFRTATAHEVADGGIVDMGGTGTQCTLRPHEDVDPAAVRRRRLGLARQREHVLGESAGSLPGQLAAPPDRVVGLDQRDPQFGCRCFCALDAAKTDRRVTGGKYDETREGGQVAQPCAARDSIGTRDQLEALEHDGIAENDEKTDAADAGGSAHQKKLRQLVLELTRFRGHRTSFEEKGVHDGKKSFRVSAGVPAQDG